MEMLREIGTCAGVENYSRPLGRAPGERPQCLIDYFPDDFLLIVDESHVTVPQVGGMYEGTARASRRWSTTDSGSPSALDNRPLRYDEFESLIHQALRLGDAGRPRAAEVGEASVEQIIRLTGLVDPHATVRPTRGQIDDLLEEIRKRVEVGERVLVTTLTKRMAEDLTEYLFQAGVSVRYIHSDIDAIGRMEVLRAPAPEGGRSGRDQPAAGGPGSARGLAGRDPRRGQGGFLRSETSLIQTAGRARHIRGEVLLYADQVTGAMRRALDEMNRRREVQIEYNAEHGITPTTIVKSVEEVMRTTSVADAASAPSVEELLPARAFDLDREGLMEVLERDAGCGITGGVRAGRGLPRPVGRAEARSGKGDDACGSKRSRRPWCAWL